MFSRLFDGIERAVTVIAMTGFIVMLLITFIQVLCRYILYVALPWSEELARILFVTSVFLGIAIAARRREHIVVDFLFNGLPPRPRHVVAILFNLLVLAFLTLWGRGAVEMSRVTWETYFVTIGWFRVGYIYAVECFGVVLTAIYILMQTADHVRALRGPAAQGEARP